MTTHKAPQGNPGDIMNWPMLKIEYRTDSDAIAKLLPPGFTVGKDPIVYLTVYNYPVMDVPEYGCTMMVAADYDGIEGQYALGYAIDQEDAVYVSREHWGQPKYLADIKYHRLMADVSARVIHHGHTFIEYNGSVSKTDGPGEEFELNEWWVKSVRDVSMEPGKFEFPPQVVRVYQKYKTAFRQTLKGELILRESASDPIAQCLPVKEVVDAYLWTPDFLDRSITKAGELDAEAFWPFAETIGGTRFPANV
ncbi:MAG: acetoacetate decarboxylase family protein [Gammaproteobacteria bacterium]|nr:acetoacetate decarboxylase family protein [Gammaproteobacteria bacterium]